MGRPMNPVPGPGLASKVKTLSCNLILLYFQGLDEEEPFSEEELANWEKEHAQPGEVNVRSNILLQYLNHRNLGDMNPNYEKRNLI